RQAARRRAPHGRPRPRRRRGADRARGPDARHDHPGHREHLPGPVRAASAGAARRRRRRPRGRAAARRRRAGRARGDGGRRRGGGARRAGPGRDAAGPVGHRAPGRRARPRRAARRRGRGHARAARGTVTETRPPPARGLGDTRGRYSARMRVAVTGSSGFVGGAVARDLAAHGHEVVAFSRRPPRLPDELGDRVSHQAWDLRDGPLPKEDRPERVDAVVHCGAAVGDGGRHARAWVVNVEGTRAVRETFPEARFVHVSSGSVYDPRTPSVAATEVEAPARGYLNAYGSTKAAAERYLAADAAREDRGPVVVLRPHAVYGPGDTTLLPRIEAAAVGAWLP